MARTSMPQDADELQLSLLQLLRLKGRVKPDDLPGSLRRPEDVCAALLASAVTDGFCVQKGTSARLTPQGRERLAALLAAERDRVDQQRLAGLYDEFDVEHEVADAPPGAVAVDEFSVERQALAIGVLAILQRQECLAGLGEQHHVQHRLPWCGGHVGRHARIAVGFLEPAHARPDPHEWSRAPHQSSTSTRPSP